MSRFVKMISAFCVCRVVKSSSECAFATREADVTFKDDLVIIKSL